MKLGKMVMLLGRSFSIFRQESNGRIGRSVMQQLCVAATTECNRTEIQSNINETTNTNTSQLVSSQPGTHTALKSGKRHSVDLDMPALLPPSIVTQEAGSGKTMRTRHLCSKTRTATSHIPIHANRACIAVGSNMGDRFQNICKGLKYLLSNEDLDSEHDDEKHVSLKETSFLHETAPMYVTDQPQFLNAVFEIETTLEPYELLKRLKQTEKFSGRQLSEMDGDSNRPQRFGPRPLDLDILFYERFDTSNIDDGPETSSFKPLIVSESPTTGKASLDIPHPRMQEREFVLTPICELSTSQRKEMVHPVLNKTMGELHEELKRSTAFEAYRVIPLQRQRFLRLNKTLVMGILNVTPDSFSDGGKLEGSVELAVSTALQMEKDGADIIDIGGESTRPGADEVSVEEELRRTIPVIQALRQVSDIPISIDTRRAKVANAAIEAGADIVNDVSGGTFDEPHMFSVVARHQVPIVIMHMRGTPQNMTKLTNYDDNHQGGIVAEISRALLEQSRKASAAGIPRWLQILDPGIGFAKDFDGNMKLLKEMDAFRNVVSHHPLLIGPSRKRFIGTILNRAKPTERDAGTIAACLACMLTPRALQDGTILRVHNIKDVKDACLVMDAIHKTK